MTLPRRSLFLNLFYLLNILYFLSFLGCSSRRSIVNRQPPPSPPVSVSPERVEAAKRSTDVDPESPLPSSSTASPKRAASRPKSSAALAPDGYAEEGNASWYGVPYHGRRASNGEIYDMYRLTAAHRTLPFETRSEERRVGKECRL